MTPTTVRSYSKINLGLRIGPPRPDGFHHLTTLFQTVALHDLVTVEARSAEHIEITLESNDPRVPTDSRNTAYRMVSAVLAQMGMDARVHLHIQKNLPVQGGMGAGSANAAAALLGLERQLGISLSPTQRLKIAEQVGSDVPVFLMGGTVYAHRRGELVLPYPDMPRMHCVAVAPPMGSSTPQAFRAWDEQITQLPLKEAHGRLDELSRVYASAFTPAGKSLAGGYPLSGKIGASGVSGATDEDGARAESEPGTGDLAGNPLLELVRTGIENDFEEVVFQQYPSLRDIKHALAGRDSGLSAKDCGQPAFGEALLAMLSGSGSTLFGLYRTEADAFAAEQRIHDLRIEAKSFVTSTVSRDEYWKTIFVP